MDQIELPSNAEWALRRDWFEAQFDTEVGVGGYTIGEHASGLLIDLQAVFCAGAYVSVMILCCAIVDAHLRETEFVPSNGGGMKSVFKLSDHQDELEWLRQRRNALVHFKDSGALALTVDDHWSKRRQHEVDARRAVMIAAMVLLENPWV